ncbi:MAG TPA: hypothetical protein PK514_09120 [Spirochaetota bacterium]|nr:hypothetical protein [Spirochaetota bacterium]
MKKFVGILIAFAIAAGFSFSAVDAKAKIKESPCQKTCAATFVQCKKDAKGDKVKIAACEASKKGCMEQCEKTVKEEKEAKDKEAKEKGKEKEKGKKVK